MDITSAESKATYRQIKDWVKENYGIKTRNEYIARVKEKYGIIEHENSRPSQNPDYVRRECPENQWKPIEEALKFFQMIYKISTSDCLIVACAYFVSDNPNI